jgi:hypothetical protein
VVVYSTILGVGTQIIYSNIIYRNIIYSSTIGLLMPSGGRPLLEASLKKAQIDAGSAHWIPQYHNPRPPGDADPNLRGPNPRFSLGKMKRAKRQRESYEIINSIIQVIYSA